MLRSILTYGSPQNFFTSLAFFREKIHDVDGPTRRLMVRKLYATAANLETPLTFDEALRFVRTVHDVRHGVPGAIVQVGCRTGSSTAVFSLVAAMSDRPLMVFDCFEELSLEWVTANVKTYGDLYKCQFVKGPVEETVPAFREPVAAAYLDVGNGTLTRTCVKALYPLLAPGGTLYSQNGNVPTVEAVFADDHFWVDEVGCARPSVVGLGTKRQVKVVKPA